MLTNCNTSPSNFEYSFKSFEYQIVVSKKGDSVAFDPYNYNSLYTAIESLDSIRKESAHTLIVLPDSELDKLFFEQHKDYIENATNIYSFNLNYWEYQNYLYPYRAGNERVQPYFDTLQNIVLKSIDNKENLPVDDVVIKANNKFKKLLKFDLRSHAMLYEPGMLELLEIGKGSCRSLTQFATLALRTVGIPTTIDECPIWAHRNSGHQWNTFMNENKEWIPFGGCETNPNEFDAINDSVKAPKIYRNTFSVNDNFRPPGKSVSEMPSLFHRTNRIDVTHEYVAVSDITLEVEDQKDEVLYLAVFNAFTWKIVDWANISNGKAHFDNLGSNKIVYLPCYFINRKVIPANPPFLLDSENITVFEEPARTLDTLNLTLYNKFFDSKWNIGRPEPESKFDLLYWEDGKWQNAGVGKYIQDSTLQFYHIPENTLMVLKSYDFDNTWQRIFRIDNKDLQIFY